jgi:hypothetical protein
MRSMSSGAPSLDLFLADWVLGRARPEDAVQLAIGALEAGCDEPSIAVIAGSNATTRADLELDLAAVLRAFHTTMPSEGEALKRLVDDCARRIASGELDPIRGAWMMWEFSANEDESPEFFDQIRLFVGHASECDNSGPHVEQHRAAIVAEARALLDRGGLRAPL